MEFDVCIPWSGYVDEGHADAEPPDALLTAVHPGAGSKVKGACWSAHDAFSDVKTPPFLRVHLVSGEYTRRVRSFKLEFKI